MNDLQQATAHCNSFQFNICLSYGARAEIVNACNKIISDYSGCGTKNNRSNEEVAADEGTPVVTESIFASYLLTNSIEEGPNNITGRVLDATSTSSHIDMGEPDILIRTSGEYRLSNFLLWQVSGIK